METYTFSDLHDGQKVSILKGKYAGNVAEIKSLTVTKRDNEYRTSYNMILLDSGEHIQTLCGNTLLPID